MAQDAGEAAAKRLWRMVEEGTLAAEAFPAQWLKFVMEPVDTGFVTMQPELLTAMVTALAPEQADIALWEKELLDVTEMWSFDE